MAKLPVITPNSDIKIFYAVPTRGLKRAYGIAKLHKDGQTQVALIVIYIHLSVTQII